MATSYSIQYSEEDLIDGLKSGDPKIISVIYERYGAALFGIIYKIVNDEHSAEDVLQEGFVKIWNNASMYDATKGRLFTWMVNICRNNAIDKLRSKDFKKKKVTTEVESFSDKDNKSYEGIKPETIGLKEIVGKLKPEWRDIIELVYFQGYSQQETSDELNVPLGTVKTRIRSAIIHLRQIM